VAEGENPTRRYKWFRPRQAVRGSGIISSPTNYGTVSVWNSSTARDLLVIRLIFIYTGDGFGTTAGTVQGQQGTANGVQNPIWPGEAALAGQICTLDSAAQITSDFASSFGTALDPKFFIYPIAILPPNWSFVVQHTAKNNALSVSFVWEAVQPDELDFMWE
jgi:hypothetical protein